MSEQTSTPIVIRVDGMTCGHCEASVEKALRALPGVTEVSVDRAAGQATIEGGTDAQTAAAAVHAIGFDATPA